MQFLEKQATQFLAKLGAAMLPPMQPHQQRVVRRLQKSNHGLVAFHSTGSGKSRLSVEAAKTLQKPTTILPPAALQENYKKELKRWDPQHTIPGLRMQSQQNAAVRGLVPQDRNSFMVIDEAARARDPESKLHQALVKSPAQKLLLTASGTYNHPADLASLVNIAANKNILPDTKPEFEKKFVKYENVNPGLIQRFLGATGGQKPMLHPTPELNRALREYVDYYASKKEDENYPALKEEDKMVNMSPRQTELYNAIMGKAPWWVRMKVKAGLPPARKDMAKMRAFLTGPRQASNSTATFAPGAPAEAAKAQEAFSYLRKKLEEDPKYRAVVYSNYLNSGLDDYKRLLSSNNVPYGEFSGEVPDAERNQAVKDYNLGKLRALLISSAGGEGLDLKNTRLVQLLEPHFNEEKENQIIGRARRFQSHASLPPEKRNVLVQRYLARPQGSFIDRLIGGGSTRGVDEYLRDMAKQKAQLNEQMIDLVRHNQ